MMSKLMLQSKPLPTFKYKCQTQMSNANVKINVKCKIIIIKKVWTKVSKSKMKTYLQSPNEVKIHCPG